MSATQLLILHKEHGLNLDEISLVLEMPRWKVREMLRGRIKPKKSKSSWNKSQRRFLKKAK